MGENKTHRADVWVCMLGNSLVVNAATLGICNSF